MFLRLYLRFGSVDEHIFDLSANPQQSLTHGGFSSLFFR
nr:MAG TPA: hypothetical protein [Caudoviricetes sp.]